PIRSPAGAESADTIETTFAADVQTVRGSTRTDSAIARSERRGGANRNGGRCAPIDCAGTGLPKINAGKQTNAISTSRWLDRAVRQLDCRTAKVTCVHFYYRLLTRRFDL